MSNNSSRLRSAARARSKSEWYKQTLITSFVSIASVLVGVFGSGWLTERDKKQELDLAATRRAIDSVESITSLLFERDARAEMIASSIRRQATVDEIKERKKLYDDIYIRFNANLQSGLFNIRDRFHSTNFNIFEDMLMSSVQELFISEDRCITSAYDAVTNPATVLPPQGLAYPGNHNDLLQHCMQRKSNEIVTFDSIHTAILRCEYTFSDNLFRVVASVGGIENLVTASREEIANACVPPVIAKQTASAK